MWGEHQVVQEAYILQKKRGEPTKLSWTHNCILLEKVKDDKVRNWYAEKYIENGWAKKMLLDNSF